ncbi:hypothetical protein PRK78_002779 [Emydomyces testavorans]|uniref:F-box domain-containing protein n=1 Tax=Emydomyces testavorans TaxID=2070801 RepID=A0AAF0IK01_9EURO|nr:hypothetical protein PRK78_002779 [Emydomyces testavorans]
MTSGIAYRWDKPSIGKLNLYSSEWHGDDQLCSLSPETDKPATAGDLGWIPLEILHEICTHLDLASLENLRSASTSCQIMVDSCLLLRRLEEHASETLEIMKVTGVSSYHTIAQIYNEFCQPLCRICGNFGPYLFLPTLIRCCHNCHYSSQKLCVAPFADVVFNYGLHGEITKQLPVVNSLPGWYGTVHSTELWVRRDKLVSTYQAEQFAIKIYGTAEEMMKAFYDRVEATGRKTKALTAYEKQLLKWARPFLFAGDFSNSSGLHPHMPVPKEFVFCDQFPTNRRFMATTAFPFYNPKTRQAESGLYCKACTLAFEHYVGKEWLTSGMLRMLHQLYHESFMKKTILRHFATCPAVKIGFADSQTRVMCKWPFERTGKELTVKPKRRENKEKQQLK